MRVVFLFKMAGWFAALALFQIAAPALGADSPSRDDRVRVISTLEWAEDDNLTASAFDRAGELLLTGACYRRHLALVNTSSLAKGRLPGIKIVGRPPEMILWDAATGKRRGVFKGHKAPVYRVAFSPDGRTVASGGAETHIPLSYVWDSGARGVRFYSGQELLTRESGAMAKLWDPGTLIELATLSAPGSYLGPIAFSGDGRLFEAFVADLGVVAWDMRTAKETMTLPVSEKRKQAKEEGPNAPRLCVDSTHLKLTVEAARQREPAESGEPGRLLPLQLETALPQLTVIAVCPDGSRVATGSHDGSVRTWDFDTGKLVTGPEANPEKVWGPEKNRTSLLVFNAEGDLFISGHRDGGVQLWNTNDGQRLAEIKGPPGPVVAAQFVGERIRLLSGGSRNGRRTAFPLDRETGRPEWDPLVVWEFDLPPK